MSELKEIIVEVEGGTVVNVTSVPPGCVVKVVDYDTEGNYEPDLSDHNGRPADISYWSMP